MIGNHGLNKVYSSDKHSCTECELESKEAKCYPTIDVANVFFSIPITEECRPNLLSAQVVSSTPGIECPRGGSTT